MDVLETFDASPQPGDGGDATATAAAANAALPLPLLLHAVKLTSEELANASPFRLLAPCARREAKSPLMLLPFCQVDEETETGGERSSGVSNQRSDDVEETQGHGTHKPEDSSGSWEGTAGPAAASKKALSSAAGVDATEETESPETPRSPRFALGAAAAPATRERRRPPPLSDVGPTRPSESACKTPTCTTPETRVDLKRAPGESFKRGLRPVSYTHLTLPTIHLV